MPARTTLLVFLKAPRLGEVKTRLAAEIGAASAVALYRTLAQHAITATAPQDHDAYEQVLCFAPAAARAEIAAWLPNRLLEAQQGADLGGRMANAIAAALSRGAARVALVGTDVPSLARRHVHDCTRLLARVDLVLGPTLDGGYYLIGMNRLHRGLFEDMPWGTNAVRSRTLARAADLGLRTASLELLRDVDTLDDLRACTPEIAKLRARGQRW